MKSKRKYLTDASTVSDYRYRHWDQLRKGLKQIHIGTDVWLIGKIAYVGNKKHQVIYGPENKEYHVYDQDVDFINTDYDQRLGVINDYGNHAIQDKFKIYVLTRILDTVENWCFDLQRLPKQGPLKVIYQNGTIRNIDFSGYFEPVTHRNWKSRTYSPIGYRLS